MSQSSALSLIAGKPLAVTAAKLQAVTDYLQTRASFQVDFSGIKINTGEPVLATERAPNGGSQYGEDVDIITVTGSLVNRSASGRSGMTNYRQCQSNLRSSIDGSDTGAILLDFQTSGGMVVGCQRTFNLIREAAKIKPVWAFVDAYAYSAGFYMAAGASRIILADAHCGVGSVGVLAMHLDVSKKLEQDGLVYTVIKAGEKKDEFSSLKPLADDTRKELQASVDRTRLVFAADVAEARGMTQAAVLDTEAGVFDGQAAIDVGFADEIASFEDTIGMLREHISGSTSFYYNTGASENAEAEEVEFMAETGKGMTMAGRIGAMMGSAPEEFAEAMKTFGYQSAESVDQQLKDLREESFEKGKAEGAKAGKKAGIEQAVSVLSAAELGEMPLVAAKGLVADGLTQEQAAERIQSYRADLSAGQMTETMTTPLTGEGAHPFLAACSGK